MPCQEAVTHIDNDRMVRLLRLCFRRRFCRWHRRSPGSLEVHCLGATDVQFSSCHRLNFAESHTAIIASF